MALDRIRQVLLNLADDEELGIRIKEVSGVSVPALLSNITMVAIQHASDLKDFSDKATYQLSEVISTSKSLSNEMMSIASQFMEVAIRNSTQGHLADIADETVIPSFAKQNAPGCSFSSNFFKLPIFNIRCSRFGIITQGSKQKETETQLFDRDA